MVTKIGKITVNQTFDFTLLQMRKSRKWKTIIYLKKR